MTRYKIIPEISVGIKFGDYKPQIAIAKTLVDLNLVVVKVDCQTAKNFWLYTHTLLWQFFPNCLLSVNGFRNAEQTSEVEGLVEYSSETATQERQASLTR